MSGRTRLALLGLAVMALACRGYPRRPLQHPLPYEGTEVTIEIERYIRAGQSFRGVVGTVTNKTEREIDSCSFAVEIMNSRGERKGSAQCVVSPLRPLATKSFKVRFDNRLVKDFLTVVIKRVRLHPEASGATPATAPSSLSNR